MEFDLFNQPTPKEVGIQLSYDKQNEIVESWGDMALDFVRVFARSNEEFITEDIRVASVGIVEEPENGKAYGAVILKACKSGIITWSGRYAEMKNPRSHSCPKKVWRSLIFEP